MAAVINSRIRKKDKMTGDGEGEREGLCMHECLQVCVVQVCTCMWKADEDRD